MKAQLEVLMPDPTHSFRSLRVEDTRFRHAIHYHPEIELTYIIKSAGTRMVGDHIEPFAAGDLCLIGSNLPHQLPAIDRKLVIIIPHSDRKSGDLTCALR